MTGKPAILIDKQLCSVCNGKGVYDFASLVRISQRGALHVDPEVCRRNLRCSGDPVRIAEGELLLDPKRILAMTPDQLVDEIRKIHKLGEAQ